MILRINIDIFQSNDALIYSNLCRLLDLWTMDRFQFDFVGTGLSGVFFDSDGNFILKNKYISEFLGEKIEEKAKKIILSPITSMDKFYYSIVLVGLELNETHPEVAVKMIEKESIIVVENYPNDWKFIESIVDKYKNFGRRKSIYQKIYSILNKQLTYDHAGGSGIVDQVEGWINGLYSDIYKYKLMVIFDSDKEYTTHFQKEYRKKIEFLKNKTIGNPPNQIDLEYETNDLIVWHMLFKRAMENYLPISVIVNSLSSLSDQQIYNLNTLNNSPDACDFEVIYKPRYHPDNLFYYINIGKTKVKEQLPNWFLSLFDVNELEQRCAHHKINFLNEQNQSEQISELEWILIKIAKIV